MTSMAFPAFWSHGLRHTTKAAAAVLQRSSQINFFLTIVTVPFGPCLKPFVYV